MPETMSSGPILALASSKVEANPYPTREPSRSTQPVPIDDFSRSRLYRRTGERVTVAHDSSRLAADRRRVGDRVPPRSRHAPAESSQTHRRSASATGSVAAARFPRLRDDHPGTTTLKRARHRAVWQHRAETVMPTE